MEKERLVIITPVYNEEKYLDELINAVIHQTFLPSLWVFVNDHSTDNSANIIDKWISKYDWMVRIDAPLLLFSNKYGPRIVAVRSVGYKYLMENKIVYDYMAHLDADIILPPDYYEKIIEEFNENRKLGICGGILLNSKTGKKEITKPWWVRDGLRVYRKICISQTGYQRIMWPHDSSDLLYAIYKNWHVLNINLLALHLRPTGSKMKLKNCYLFGKDIRLFGYNTISAIFKSYKYAKRKPYLLGTFYFLAGYIKMAIHPEPYYFEKDFRIFLNQFYLKNL